MYGTLGGSTYCNFHRLRMHEGAVGGIPLGLGFVVGLRYQWWVLMV